jgi:hypothetical protein
MSMSGDRLQQPVEAGALVAPFRAAYSVILIDSHHLPAVAFCNGLQLALLIFCGLAVRSAGPNVEPSPHGF